jgi:hypothetical protein
MIDRAMDLTNLTSLPSIHSGSKGVFNSPISDIHRA